LPSACEIGRRRDVRASIGAIVEANTRSALVHTWPLQPPPMSARRIGVASAPTVASGATVKLPRTSSGPAVTRERVLCGEPTAEAGDEVWPSVNFDPLLGRVARAAGTAEPPLLLAASPDLDPPGSLGHHLER